MTKAADYMQQALQAAARALGRTRPNPVVGCVIVKNHQVVGVGHHVRAGADHAEVAALKMAGKHARGADVYVTLEPCNHVGRTGPCTQALIEAGVKRVFAGMRDPNPIVDGRGKHRLESAGIEVSFGLLHDACARLNEGYIRYICDHRPFVVAKVAQSLDGRVATRTGNSRWISGPESRARSHALRNELDAILVGVGTVLADDPELTCRIPKGRDPVRIILDTHARTPIRAKVVALTQQSGAPTLVVVGPEAPERQCRALEKAGAQVLRCKVRQGHIDLVALLKLLHDRELLTVLVEGGPRVLGGFADAGLIDKLHLFLAPMLIGGDQARSSVAGKGVAELNQASRFERTELTPRGQDLEWVGYLRR